MRISAHFWTPEVNHTVVETNFPELHSHINTQCLIGKGLIADHYGSLPADYSLWADGQCIQAVGKHNRFVNDAEASVDWDEAL